MNVCVLLASAVWFGTGHNTPNHPRFFGICFGNQVVMNRYKNSGTARNIKQFRCENRYKKGLPNGSPNERD